MIEIVATDREQQRRALSASDGDNLMELLRDHDLEVEAVCGGCCSCATCHVLIDNDWFDRLPARGALETELLSLSDHFDDRLSRLSCQLTASPQLHGLQLTIAPED